MITSGIFFKNFKKKKEFGTLKKKLNSILKENNNIVQSLSSNYRDSFDKKKIKGFKKFLDYRIIGMGGSSLGTQAIYDFLNHKIKKNFSFLDNLQPNLKNSDKKKYLNLIVSKSGNTIETIANSNIYIKKKRSKYFYN